MYHEKYPNFLKRGILECCKNLASWWSYKRSYSNNYEKIYRKKSDYIRRGLNDFIIFYQVFLIKLIGDNSLQIML